MAQDSLSSLTQSIGNPGPLILTSRDPDSPDPNATLTVTFSPAKAVIRTPQFAPVQRINISDDTHIHVFQLSTNEELRWDIDFEDLPWADESTERQGYRTLRRFIRVALNYSQYSVSITSPDGDIETMLYMGGLETFEEAAGRTEKREMWTGTLAFRRLLA